MIWILLLLGALVLVAVLGLVAFFAVVLIRRLVFRRIWNDAPFRNRRSPL